MSVALRNPARYGGELDLGRDVSAPDAGAVPGRLVIEGQSPGLHRTATVAPGVAAIALAGLLATVFTGTLQPGVGALRLQGDGSSTWPPFRRLTLRDQSIPGVFHLSDVSANAPGLGGLVIEGLVAQVVTTDTALPGEAQLTVSGLALATGLVPTMAPGAGRIVVDPTVKVKPIHRLPTFLRDPANGGGHLDLSETDPYGAVTEKMAAPQAASLAFDITLPPALQTRKPVTPGVCPLHLDTVMYGCIRPPLGILDIRAAVLRAFGLVWFDQPRFTQAEWTGPVASVSLLWSLTVADALAWGLVAPVASLSWSSRSAVSGSWGPAAAAVSGLVWYDKAASAAGWSDTAGVASTAWSEGAPDSAAWSPAGPVTASFVSSSPVTAATWRDI